MKRLTTVAGLGLGLMLSVAACTSQESTSAAKQYIGKDRTQIAQELGKPTNVVPLTDTGGEMLYYSYQGHHYVFEVGPDGLVQSAVETNAK